MTPAEWSAVGSFGGFLVMAGTLYLTYLRPKLAIRGRVIDKLVGHDGRDGLPKEKSIFELLGDIVDEQGRQRETLAQLLSEFPKNGISARAAVDLIANDLRRATVRDDQRWSTLTAALLAHNIKLPTEG